MDIKKGDKTKTILFRISTEEKKILNDLLAKSIHKKLSPLLRDLIFKSQVKMLSTDENLIREQGILISQSKKIGANFNQLVKLIHSKKLNYFTQDDIKNTLDLLKQIKNLYLKIANTSKQ